LISVFIRAKLTRTGEFMTVDTSKESNLG
jgi:hypothetical protein